MKQYKLIVVTAGSPGHGESELNRYAKEGWEVLNMATMDQRGWIVYTLVKHTFEKK